MSAIDSTLSYAKNLNIDECEAVTCKKRIITVRITDSEIAEIKQNNEKKLGVRIIHDKKISSAETNILDEAKKTLESAFESTRFQKPKNFWKSLPHKLGSTASLEKTFDTRLAKISSTEAADISQEMINSAFDKKISKITGSLNIVSETFEIGNSHGLHASDNATYISATINADSDVGITPVSGIGYASCRTLDAFSAESVGKDAAQMCIDSINPKKCDEDTYSIIFEPYSVGELLAFVFSSNFNIKTFTEKRSCFLEKLESKIAVDDFDLIDNPHAPEGIGSKSFDDEGITTKPLPLIENGIFKNVYSNLFDAYKENKESSANAARPSSPMGRSTLPTPVSDTHNLQIKSGKVKKDEIIKDTKRGILVGRLWYTYAVNPLKGDFSCTARSGIQIIENGQIKYPGKSVRIVHNLPVLLQNISAIGNDSKNVLQWDSLPSIAPSIKADGIRIIPI